jgi:hypothetical protein
MEWRGASRESGSKFNILRIKKYVDVMVASLTWSGLGSPPHFEQLMIGKGNLTVNGMI